MSRHQCTLDRVLDIVDRHFDELRKWNHGGLTTQLRHLDQWLAEQTKSQQTAAWLDSLASRNSPLMQFLLSRETNPVAAVREEVDAVVNGYETVAVRGPSTGKLAAEFEQEGQVVNSTVTWLRKRIQALTSTPAPDRNTEPSETPEPSASQPATQV